MRPCVITSDTTMRGTTQRERNLNGVIANPGRFIRGVAISSLARTLLIKRVVPESEEIATTKKLSRDDTG